MNATPTMTPSDDLTEMAQFAARLVVDEGLDYASARRQARKALGDGAGRTREALTTEMIEDEVRAHIAIFCADTQPGELRALRTVARRWMHRLAEFRPHLGGAVWRGTATRQSAIRIDLFCDDPKAPEIALLNQHVAFETASKAIGGGEHLLVHSITEREGLLQDWVTVHLSVLDLDELRGALRPDARGRTWRGDLAALDRLMRESAP